MAHNNETILRAGRAEEHRILTDLCMRSKAVWGYDAAFMEQCRDELTLAPEDCSSANLRVAERAGMVVGVAEISVEERECYLEKLFVDPDVQEAGIGRHLLQWAADRARQLGQSELIIESDPGAEGFYQRSGADLAGTASSSSIAGRTLPRLILPLA